MLRRALPALMLGLLLEGKPAAAPTTEVVETAVEDAGGRALAPLHARLEALRAGRLGRVRITHFGDSHLTSDIFSGLLRESLQQTYGDGGPGLVLLGKPWPSYRHSQVKTGAEPGWVAERLWTRYGRGRFAPRDDLFGVAGISVHAIVPTRTFLELRGPGELRAVDLYFLRQPEGGRLELLLGDRRLRWFFLAASDKEPDEARVELPAGTRRLDLRAALGEVRLYGADLSSGRRGVVYDVLGQNGARAASLLAWNEALLARQLRRLGPDLVILAYGSNEVDNEALTRASFAQSFDEALQRMRRLVPTASCLVIGPPDRARYHRGRGFEIPESLTFIVEEERRVSRLRGCAFWDQRAAMGGPGSILRWVAARPPLADRDYVHLTGEAYRRLARALHRALFPAPLGASAR